MTERFHVIYISLIYETADIVTYIEKIIIARARKSFSIYYNDFQIQAVVGHKPILAKKTIKTESKKQSSYYSWRIRHLLK